MTLAYVQDRTVSDVTAPALTVLIVHNEYLNRGGEDSVLESERDLLRAYGHRVEVFKMSAKSLKSPMDKLRAARNLTYSESSKQAVIEEIRRVGPDVVHVHNFVPLLTPSVFDACQESGVPVVQTLHNFRYLCSASSLFRAGRVCEDCIAGSHYQAVLHRCYRGSAVQSLLHAHMLTTHEHKGTWARKVDRFIAVSNFAKGKYVEGGFRPDQIEVKHNFVSKDLENPQARGEVVASRTRAVFVGRLTPEKGVLTMLRAWQDLRMPLDIVGDGPLLEELQRATLPNVTVHGRKSREETVAMMRSAKALIMPSEWYEACPMVLIEAMSQSTPIITTNLGGMAELVIDGQTGLQFPPGDSAALAERARWALSHPAEFQELGRRGRKRFEEQFTASRNYARLMEIYGAVIAEKRAMVNAR